MAWARNLRQSPGPSLPAHCSLQGAGGAGMCACGCARGSKPLPRYMRPPTRLLQALGWPCELPGSQGLRPLRAQDLHKLGAMVLGAQLLRSYGRVRAALQGRRGGHGCSISGWVAHDDLCCLLRSAARPAGSVRGRACMSLHGRNTAQWAPGRPSGAPQALTCSCVRPHAAAACCCPWRCSWRWRGPWSGASGPPSANQLLSRRAPSLQLLSTKRTAQRGLQLCPRHSDEQMMVV